MLKLDDIDLPEVTSEEDIEEVRLMMTSREIWRNLARMEQPKKGKFFLLFQTGKYAAHFIRLKKTEHIGFFLLDKGRLKSSGKIEVDIAIPSTEYRKQGASLLAMAHLFDTWLLTDRCAEFWAWIDTGNTASVKMIEAMKIPIASHGAQDGIMVDGRVDTIEVYMNKDVWTRIKGDFLAAYQ